MDTQVIELFGHNRLVDELLTAGPEVATPARDRGIDLRVYADLVKNTERFTAWHIQTKVSSNRAFVTNRKYGKFSGLLIAYVWNLRNQDDAETYAVPT